MCTLVKIMINYFAKCLELIANITILKIKKKMLNKLKIYAQYSQILKNTKIINGFNFNT